MATLFELTAERLVGEDNHLMQLNKLIDWCSFKRWLKGLHRNELHGEGRSAYDSIAMLKAVLLGQWHNLSDPELERSLRTRLDFMLFTGFGFEGDDVPDETTLCRFRNKLFNEGRAEKLFRELNRQLSNHGLAIEKARGAIVDATVIESAARPSRMIDAMAEDRNEESSGDENAYCIVDSADPDARWLKKGRKCHFGYKGFFSTEGEHGFIQSMVFTPANVYEGKMLAAVIKNLSPEAVLADKGYADGMNRYHLHKRGIIDGIMRKASRNNPLTQAEKQLNKYISKFRFKVEQCFGTLKRRFQFSRASYMGIQKVAGQAYLKAMCFNLLKANNLVTG